MSPAVSAKTLAAQHLELIMERENQAVNSIVVLGDSPFSVWHKFLLAQAHTCDILTDGLRTGPWPADVQPLVTTFLDLQTVDCTIECARARTKNMAELNKIPLLGPEPAGLCSGLVSHWRPLSGPDWGHWMPPDHDTVKRQPQTSGQLLPPDPAGTRALTGLMADVAQDSIVAVILSSSR